MKNTHKRNSIVLVLFLAFVLLSFTLFSTSAFALTNASTCEELQLMKLDLSEDYQLLNDINCSNTSSWNQDTYLDFGGSDGDHVDCGNSDSLNTDYNTVSAWVNLDSTSGYHGIAGKSTSQYGVYVQDGNAKYAIVDGGSFYTASGTTSLNTGQWYHITGSYDGSTVKVYVDGSEDRSTSHTGTIDSTTNQFTIGDDATFDWSLDGSIDDVRIFNRSLSESEIQDLYAVRHQPLGDEVAHWKFNEGSGTIAEDTSGTNNGTITGATTWDGTDNYLGFEPIGNHPTYFTGTFDGQNYTISNLFINRSINDVGLFGKTAAGTEIKDVGMVDVNYTADGGFRAGGLIGWSTGTVLNSYTTGIIDSNKQVGGLVGRNENIINNSYSTVNVRGGEYVGGFIGYGTGSNVANSYATGTVTCSTGSGDLGGYIGTNYQGKIINSYSTGSVHYESAADPTSKGFAGSVDTGGDYEMTGNYWNNETSGQTSSAGEGAGEVEGRTTDEMTWVYGDNTYVGWDFTNIWQDERHTLVTDHEGNSGYPALQWQGFPFTYYKISKETGGFLLSVWGWIAIISITLFLFGLAALKRQNSAIVMFLSIPFLTLTSISSFSIFRVGVEELRVVGAEVSYPTIGYLFLGLTFLAIVLIITYAISLFKEER